MTLMTKTPSYPSLKKSTERRVKSNLSAHDIHGVLDRVRSGAAPEARTTGRRGLKRRIMIAQPATAQVRSDSKGTTEVASPESG
jgi:hypothetical protein